MDRTEPELSNWIRAGRVGRIRMHDGDRSCQSHGFESVPANLKAQPLWFIAGLWIDTNSRFRIGYRICASCIVRYPIRNFIGSQIRIRYRQRVGRESKILKFLGFMWNPLSWVMEMAAVMAIALANGDNKLPDWQDFVGIVVLLVINSTISFIEENNAGNAAAALMAGLAPKTKVCVCDQLAIAKETGRRLGMGTNMYPSSSLLGENKDASIAALPVDELIEKADGFAGVFPEHKYEIVKKLQERKHICGMTGDGVNDAPALKKADIGIAVADATDAARSASDIVLTEPGLSVIISAVLTSRAIFQRMKNYTVATVIAVYADWGFARIKGIGWGWAGVIWLYSIVFFFPLDWFKFAIRYILSGKAWDNLLQNKTAFTTKKDYGKEEREAQWAMAQRTLHGLQPPETTNLFSDKNSYRELSEIAEQAKRRAEIARLRELHTLKGHVESVVKLKGLDIDTIQQHYTV
ncbi:hypothetical protein BHM03_00010263 [Ensete ventricosum]|uniref:Cation-transporting P-type ATPase N-terminal domain-containing protein n=1 Tax=Ensete ventricosum TaxID=4639 RepID=A0A445MD06_ENSVE|nr:hypothetical protein BHM03_00010263 [Ensete ventricosum]